MILYVLLLMSICLPTSSAQHLLSLQRSLEEIAHSAPAEPLLPKFRYTEQDAKLLKAHMEKILSQKVAPSEADLSDSLGKLKNKISDPLYHAIVELTRAYRDLENIFGRCICHSIRLRFDAILRIVGHILNNYQTTDHVEYTSIGSGGLLQEALTMHLLKKYGYTNCTLNAIDILYFDEPTALEQLQILHAQIRTSPEQAKETLLELYQQSQKSIAHFKNLFPAVELYTYQHGYLYQYQKRNKVKIDILTLIDPDYIGLELDLPNLPTIEKPSDQNLLHEHRYLLMQLLDVDTPGRNNVLLINRKNTDEKQQKEEFKNNLRNRYRDIVYLPTVKKLPPFVLWQDPRSEINLELSQILKNRHGLNKVSSIGNVLEDLAAPYIEALAKDKDKMQKITGLEGKINEAHEKYEEVLQDKKAKQTAKNFARFRVSAATDRLRDFLEKSKSPTEKEIGYATLVSNPYLIFFDIALTMMNPKGIVCYTKPHHSALGNVDKEIMFVTHDIAQQIPEIYNTSMEYLAGALKYQFWYPQ